MKNKLFGKIFLVLAILIFILAIILVVLNTKNKKQIEVVQEKAINCTMSGGQIVDASCCLSASDFPNTCLIGACGCAPENSHQIKICDCGEDKCFDGQKCVSR